MNTKQLTYPSIKIQEQFWIDKETVSDNATSETRDAKLQKTILHVEQIRLTKANVLLSEALDRMMSGQPPAYGRTWTTCLKIKRYLKTYGLSQSKQTTTADPKPEDEELSRTEATTDWYDHYEVERNDFDRGDLRDEGRNPNGDGESYSERNR